MTKITVLGATGFAGGNIAQEAIARGHELTLVSRSTPEMAGARVVQGSVLEADVLDSALDGAEVVVGALSPRGDMAGRVREAYAEIARRLAGTDARLVVIGGFGSLKTPDGGRIADTPDFVEDYRPEAREMLSVLLDLEKTEGLDWTFVSPAGAFGSFIPNQERRGVYRTGGDTPIFDDEGETAISGADFGLAVVDMIESGEHRGTHVNFAY